ncbi:MAG: ImmA/IrrE family metallo-endopeptidase [Betaproteobacteria bacterium]|nr:ImmA/IrrE family metallo-endopeptidase [Betaproteobacteria bacterium]
MTSTTVDDLEVAGEGLDGQGAERAILDQLLLESRLYTRSEDYLALMAFVARLRNFAPFNAMLLHIQRPGLTFAASSIDWKNRFGRTIKEDARPLVILWPFGPVMFVYDILDTEGEPLPEGAFQFPATGSISDDALSACYAACRKRRIAISLVDKGDANAGRIRARHDADGNQTGYEVAINRNHGSATQFVTLLHELGHLFLSHLGSNKTLKIPTRHALTHEEREFEAESVAYLLALRQGIQPSSHTYLAGMVGRDFTLDGYALHPILRAAGQIETLLGLAHPQFTHSPAPTNVDKESKEIVKSRAFVPNDWLSLPPGTKLVRITLPNGTIIE